MTEIEQIKKNYKNEFQLIRYASMLFHSKKNNNRNASQLVKLANDLKYFAYPNTLMTLIKIDEKKDIPTNKIPELIKNYLRDCNQEKVVLLINQTDISYLEQINKLEEIEEKKNKIIDVTNNFYKSGNFERFNRNVYRFISRMKEIELNTLREIVEHYTISCICMNEYYRCFQVIGELATKYPKENFHIYLFFLHLFNGDLEKANDEILFIKTRKIKDDDRWFNMIAEEDLALYFSLCLLLYFNVDTYKKVLTSSDTLVYELYDKYPKRFELVDEYNKCNYLKVNSEYFEKTKTLIAKDSILGGFSEIIEEKFLRRILKEILSFTNEISLGELAGLLFNDKSLEGEEQQTLDKKKEEDEKRLEKMIDDLIRKDKFPCCRDAIDKIVYTKEISPLEKIIDKSADKMQQNLYELVGFSIQNVQHKIDAKLYDIYDANVKKEKLDLNGKNQEIREYEGFGVDIYFM